MSDEPKDSLSSKKLFESLAGEKVPSHSPPPPTETESVSSEPTANAEIVSGLAVELNPAPVVKRILALTVDYGILTLASYALFLVVLLFGVPFFIFLRSASEWIQSIAIGLGTVLIVLLVLLGMFAMHAYFIWREFKKGATIGKGILGLRVVSATTGGPITQRQAIIRELSRWYIDGLILPPLISMSLSKKRQRIGDLLADTIVVYSKSSEQISQFRYVFESDYRVLLTELGKPEISTKEMDLFLTFANKNYLDRRPISPEEEAQWVDFAHSRIPRAKMLGLNNETLLRFLAQYCDHGNEPTQKE